MAMPKQNNIQDKQYLRMTLNERFQHFFLLSSFITLVITGFALKFPEAMWVRWFTDIFGEGAFEFRGDLHRIAAVVMVAVSFYHTGYIIFTKRGRKLVSDLWFKKSDITDFISTIKYYLGKTKEHPKYRRFSYIEKMEYWAVIWGTVVMGITGSVLWFENTFLPVISNSGMDIATAIHYYEAILASLAILVWHFYFVIYNPDIYPMNKAWFTGNLSKKEMENEHPLWLEEIEKESGGQDSEKKEEKQEENTEVKSEEKITDIKTAGKKDTDINSIEETVKTTAAEDRNITKSLAEEESGKDGSETETESVEKTKEESENKSKEDEK